MPVKGKNNEDHQIVRGLALRSQWVPVMLLGAGATSEAGNRCTDQCADIFQSEEGRVPADPVQV